MGKVGAIFGTLLMPLIREKYGFESVMASCALSMLAASVIGNIGLPKYHEAHAVNAQHDADLLYQQLYGNA